MGGEAGLVEYIGALHDMDMLAVLYVNARLANVNGESYHAPIEWRALTQTGHPREERVGGETASRHVPRLSLADHLVSEVRRVAEIRR